NRCLSAIVGLKIPELLCTSEEFSLSIEDIATKSGCTSSKQLYPMMRVLAQWGIGKELENKRFAKTQAMELLRRDKGPSLGHMLEYFGSDEFIMATRQMATSIRHGEPAFVLEHGMTHLQYMYEFDQSPDDKGKTSEGSSEHPSYDRRRELANNYESAMAYMTDLLILPEDPGVHNVYKAFPWSTCSRLVDMGGSTGYFLASILKQPDCEHIQGYVVELPEAVNDAPKKIQNLGIPQHRMEFIKHDFTKPFPSELQLQVDTVMFKNVIVGVVGDDDDDDDCGDDDADDNNDNSGGGGDDDDADDNDDCGDNDDADDNDDNSGGGGDDDDADDNDDCGDNDDDNNDNSGGGGDDDDNIMMIIVGVVVMMMMMMIMMIVVI
ncbi:hypothetical protein QZH41_009269, partial [Actinostola sp. cb2023]